VKLYNLIFLPLAFLILACADDKHYTGKRLVSDPDSVETEVVKPAIPVRPMIINTGDTQPGELLTFANSLIGIPYKYGSIDPNQGFDCSGFITYVFNHHGIAVPRSSIDFTHVEKEIKLRESKGGDLILFTGTDSTVRDVGHMGIITENNGRDISSIHSTSGEAYGVAITPLNKYYQGRFVKAIRIFKN
jgi:cell wall-associated NlpC family hydrolase